MSLALQTAVNVDIDPAPPPCSKRGELTWELAALFPRQGEWTEEEYLSHEFEGLVEYVDGVVGERRVKRPIIISMSGNSVEDQREAYQGRVIDGFLQKPIKKQDLIDLFKVL